MGKKKKIENDVVGGMPLVTFREEPLDDKIKFEGVPCDYVQFSTKPVPPIKGKEPVWELKTVSRDVKYLVESIIYAPDGVVIQAQGKSKIVPLSNVAYVQPI